MGEKQFNFGHRTVLRDTWILLLRGPGSISSPAGGGLDTAGRGVVSRAEFQGVRLIVHFIWKARWLHGWVCADP